MNYIRGLDTLRAFAVIFVLIWHFIPRSELYSFFGCLEQFFLPTGVFGVTLFFVLSGYLISKILLYAKQNDNKKLHIIKNFVIRRALRIFPIYYLLLLILLIISYPFSKGELPYLFSYTSNIFIFENLKWSNLGQTWSLSVEEQFYLIWPWLIIFVNDKNLKNVFILFIIIGIASSFIIAVKNGIYFDSPAGVFTTSCFDSFGIGGLYAYLEFKKYKKKSTDRTVKVFFFLAIIISYYWKICPYFDLKHHFFYLSRLVDSLLSIGIIHFVIKNKSKILKKYLFENVLLNSIGRVSYGMYLFHYPLALYFRKANAYFLNEYPKSFFFNNVYIVFFVEFLVVYVIAFLSFEIIEKNILKLKVLFEY